MSNVSGNVGGLFHAACYPVSVVVVGPLCCCGCCGGGRLIVGALQRAVLVDLAAHLKEIGVLFATGHRLDHIGKAQILEHARELIHAYVGQIEVDKVGEVNDVRMAGGPLMMMMMVMIVVVVIVVVVVMVMMLFAV